MKYIVLILLTLLVSGCSVDYHLVIDENNNFHENILIKSENSQESKELSENSWPVKVSYYDADLGENPEKIEGVSYYVDDLFLENNYYYRRLTYDFSQNAFSGVNSIRSCYKNFYVTEDTSDKTVTLSTSAEFLCMEQFSNLREVNVQIEVLKPVISSNASSIHDNIYEWKITPENYQESGIVITFPKNYKAPKEEEDLTSKIILAVLFIGIFFIFILGVLFYKVKKGK